jgi:hypothetical protein
VLQAFQKGDYEGLPKTKEGLEQLAKFLGVNTELLLTQVTTVVGVKGATNEKTLAIDVTEPNKGTVIETLGHETAHRQGVKSETVAGLSGSSVGLIFDATTGAMQPQLSEIQASLGDGKDAATQAQSQALLKQDNAKFMEALKDSPKAMEFWGSVGHQTTMAGMTYAGGLDATRAKALGEMAWKPDTDDRNAMNSPAVTQGRSGTGPQVDIHFLNAGNDEGYVKAKAAFKEAEKSGTKDEIDAAKMSFESAAKIAVTNAQAKAAEVIAEAVTIINKLDPKSEEYKAFVNDEKWQNALHLAGDVFAHVQVTTGMPYAAGMGHAVDSLKSMVVKEEDRHDPDNPAQNPIGYKAMSTTIYNATKSVTGAPNFDKTTADAAVEAVSRIKDGDVKASQIAVNNGLPTDDGKPIADKAAPEPSFWQLFWGTATAPKPIISGNDIKPTNTDLQKQGAK